MARRGVRCASWVRAAVSAVAVWGRVPCYGGKDFISLETNTVYKRGGAPRQWHWPVGNGLEPNIRDAGRRDECEPCGAACARFPTALTAVAALDLVVGDGSERESARRLGAPPRNRKSKTVRALVRHLQ